MIYSAGLILVNDFSIKERKILLLKAHNFWDFPKGGVEKNETKLCAAIRELKEETGISNIEFKWGKAFYETEPFGKNKKVACYFMASTKEKKVSLERNPKTGIIEHEDFYWASFKEADGMVCKRLQDVIFWAQDRILLFDE